MIAKSTMPAATKLKLFSENYQAIRAINKQRIFHKLLTYMNIDEKALQSEINRLNASLEQHKDETLFSPKEIQKHTQTITAQIEALQKRLDTLKAYPVNVVEPETVRL